MKAFFLIRSVYPLLAAKAVVALKKLTRYENVKGFTTISFVKVSLDMSKLKKKIIINLLHKAR